MRCDVKIRFAAIGLVAAAILNACAPPREGQQISAVTASDVALQVAVGAPSTDDRSLGRVAGVATLPDLPIAPLQNAALPGSITVDRNILLGGVGSGLWRGQSDPRDEFWMVTDRGPNAKVARALLSALDERDERDEARRKGSLDDEGDEEDSDDDDSDDDDSDDDDA